MILTSCSIFFVLLFFFVMFLFSSVLAIVCLAVDDGCHDDACKPPPPPPLSIGFLFLPPMALCDPSFVLLNQLVGNHNSGASYGRRGS